MKQRAEFLACEGENTATAAFLMRYQQSSLFALQQQGLLCQEEVERCLILLNRNDCKVKTHNNKNGGAGGVCGT